LQYQHVVVTRRGPPDVIEVRESTLPKLKSRHVRVKVAASGVAFADILMRYGIYPGTPKPPFTLGYDITGNIAELGKGVKGFQIGQAVVALTVRGGNSEYVDLSTDELVIIPHGLDPAEVVALVLNYTTAYQMLIRKAQVQSGDRVLVHGAAGGVGTAVLQIGRKLGLEMYGTASAPKHSIVRDLGATPIDYRNSNFRRKLLELCPGGVDVVLDGIGGSNFHRSYSCLAPEGWLIGYGTSSAIGGHKASMMKAALSMISLGALRIRPGQRRVTFYNITKEKSSNVEHFKSDLSTLVGWLKASAIKPVIATRLPLSKAAEAHELLESSSVAGKIVLVCADDPT